MIENETRSPQFVPAAKRRLPLPAMLVVGLVAAAGIIWLLTTDVTRKWWTARSGTPQLEQAVRRAPDTPWPYYELGIRYARSGRLPEAVKLFERARQAGPESPEIRLALGKAYVYSQTPQAAATELRRAAELDPDNPAVYRYLSMALRLSRDREGALAAAQKATKLDPRNPDGWYQYGVLYSAAQGNESEGRPFLKKAVELAPTDGVYALAYGRSLADASQFGDAVPYLRTAVKALPNDYNAHFFLGLCLHRGGKGAADAPEAERELVTAIRIASDDYMAHFELGSVLEEQGKFKEALPEFQTAAKLHPDLVDIYYHLSRMYDRAGQRKEAEQARARFKEMRGYHTQFTTLVHQLQLNPKDTSLQVRVGNVLEKQNKPKEAAVQYLDVLKRDPANAQAKASLEALRVRMHWPKLPEYKPEGAN